MRQADDNVEVYPWTIFPTQKHDNTETRAGRQPTTTEAVATPAGLFGHHKKKNVRKLLIQIIFSFSNNEIQTHGD